MALRMEFSRLACSNPPMMGPQPAAPPPRDDLHEPMTMGPHRVSGLWRALVPEDAEWLRLPGERFADCAVCAPSMRGEYDPGCRCCGYVPHVPNILLGLALEDPESAPRIRDAIGLRIALPSGLWASPERYRRSIVMDATGGFGTDRSMACPFLEPETGACGIHPYRNSVCSTFFCVNDHGEPGEKLWASVHALLGTAETAAAQWAMGEAGLPWSLQAARMAELADDLDSLSTPDEGWTVDALRHLWGEWSGREEAFYGACIAALRSDRVGLFDRLAHWDTTDAVAFEQAVRDWVPHEHRHEVPPIAEDGVVRVPIDDLWYRLQLKIRDLWALPLGEGVVRWGDRVRLAPPSGRLPLLMGGLNRVAGAERIFWFTDDQVALFRRFAPGCRIDTLLLESPEAEALEDVRGFLSECLRRGILVVD